MINHVNEGSGFDINSCKYPLDSLHTATATIGITYTKALQEYVCFWINSLIPLLNFSFDVMYIGDYFTEVPAQEARDINSCRYPMDSYSMPHQEKYAYFWISPLISLFNFSFDVICYIKDRSLLTTCGGQQIGHDNMPKNNDPLRQYPKTWPPTAIPWKKWPLPPVDSYFTDIFWNFTKGIFPC